MVFMCCFGLILKKCCLIWLLVCSDLIFICCGLCMKVFVSFLMLFG